MRSVSTSSCFQMPVLPEAASGILLWLQKKRSQPGLLACVWPAQAPACAELALAAAVEVTHGLAFRVYKEPRLHAHGVETVQQELFHGHAKPHPPAHEGEIESPGHAEVGCHWFAP